MLELLFVTQMRLLQLNGDLVCGMDFHVDVREGWDRHWRNIPAAEIMPYGPHGPQLGVSLPIKSSCPCTPDTTVSMWSDVSGHQLEPMSRLELEAIKRPTPCQD